MKNSTYLCRKLLFLVFIFMFSLSGFSQQKQNWITAKNGEEIGFYEYVPANYSANPTLKYPVIIFLHGAGERGNGRSDLHNILLSGTPPKLIADGNPMTFTWNGKTESFIVISPQCNSKYGWWQNWMVDELLAYVAKTYRIDENRIILTGLSMGGGGTWQYAGASLNNAKKLAAIGVSCGACTNIDRCNLANANLPVWAFHAKDDNSAAPYSCTVGTIAAINACNPKVVPYFTSYETGNHWIWTRVYDPTHNNQDPNLYEWFLAQNKSLAPNKRPIINAPDVTTTSSLATAVLDASASTDPDGRILRYVWTKISGPGGNLAALFTLDGKVNVTSLTTEGKYVFEVKVIDDRADWTTKQITLNVVAGSPGSKKPFANAGGDFSVFYPSTTTNLDGTASRDDDGEIKKWEWSQVKGPTTITFVNNNSARPTVNNLALGYYTFKLVVTDNNGLTAEDQVDVTVSPSNILPFAKAGADIHIQLPTNSATLDGTASYDSDGTLKAYEWSYVSGPSQYKITDETAVKTTVTNLVEGTYEFKIRVWDNWYNSTNDTVKIFVGKETAPTNRAPVANAGADRGITLPTQLALLDGSGSSDPDNNISTYAWTKVSGPASFEFSNGSSSTTNVTKLEEGTYEFKLTVTDAGGLNSSDIVVVTVNPKTKQAPVANAGPDREIMLPLNSASLDGSGSSDPDDDIQTYAWTKVNGPTAHTFANSAAVSTTVSDLEEGTYEFKLTVTDATGLSSSDIVIVKVNPKANQRPVADAGTDRNITLPVTSTNLDGSASKDEDNNIKTYLWSWVSGPTTYTIDNPAEVSTGLSNLVEGTYVFKLTVTDEEGLSASDEVTVIVNPVPAPDNQPPVANAGTDFTVTLPANGTLKGGASNDNDGIIVSYLWEWVSGPTQFTINTKSSANTVLSNLAAGTYVFKLTVTDNGGLKASDNVTVTVNPDPNKPPVANAGSPIIITLPLQTTTLDGSASSDPEGKTLTYAWSYVSGPNSYSFADASVAKATVSGLVVGVYRFQLQVTDPGGLTSSATVDVTVKIAPNKLPKANAGADFSVTLPAQPSLNGSSSSDEDGTISTWKWTRYNGPGTVTINNSTTKLAAVTGAVVGVHYFELVVTDNKGGIGKDTVIVTVKETPNKAPVAKAGTDITITLPVQTATLDGSGSSDPEGKTLSYLWTYINGPTPYSFTDDEAVRTTVTGLAQGTYSFQLLVTDDRGLTAKDTVRVIVKPVVIPPNKLPTANAGADFSVTLPNPVIQLNGSASSDQDGTINTWKWNRVSGPGAVTINNGTTKQANVLGAAAGVHLFELIVTDDRGGVDKDTVKVTVNNAPNKLPVAIAGKDTTIAVPANLAVLDGSASFDPDGVITSARWRQLEGPREANLTTPNNIATNAASLSTGTYEFELLVTDNKGAVAKDTMKVHVVNNFKYTEELVLYPNPTTGPMNMRCISDTEGDAVAIIVDMAGHVVKRILVNRSQSVTIFPLTVADLRPGVYYLHLNINNKKTMVTRFVKQ